MRYRSRVISCLVVACAFIYLQACRSGQRNNPDRVMRLNYSSGTIESIDPAFAKNLYNMWTVHMVYNTLVETDEQLRLCPSLATRWTVSPDGLLYTLYLRTDVYFQDNSLFAGGKGRRMTAADVVYSFSRLTDPLTASTGGWIFNGRVASDRPFRVIDDTTVQIFLVRPFRPLLQLLTMPYCSIVPHEVVEHWGKDFRSHPCGTGPFQYHYWDEGNALILHKNRHYWERDNEGNHLPYLEAVHISFADSKATEFFLFMQHELDFVNGVDGSFKDLIVSKNGSLKQEYQSKFRLTRQTYFNTEYLGILTDTTNSMVRGQPAGNQLVRQAMNYAIDRNKIVTYFRNGMAVAGCGGFIPPGMPGFDTAMSFGYRYDPQKSAALLRKAGYPNGKGLAPITIATPDNWSDIVNFVAGELQDVGIPVKIEVMQPNLLRQQMAASQLPFFRAQWIADFPDAESYLAFFNSRYPAPPNYTRFHDSLFDRWYDDCLNAPDTLRWQLYRKMDSLAMSYAPVMPLYYDQLLHFTQNYVSGFSSNPMNIIELKRVQINR